MAPVYDTWNPGLMPTFKYEIAWRLWWYIYPPVAPALRVS